MSVLRVISNLPEKEYLRAMKGSLESRFAFQDERIVGTVIGPFFSVAHCAGHEFNRRITDEKNRAMGFVRTRGAKTEVCFVHTTGMTNPLSLVTMYVLCIVMFAVAEVSILSEPAVWIGSLVATGITAVVTAVSDSVTERGIAGYQTLIRFLEHPEKFTRWYE